ncbi:unnamed protein product [Clonostachys rosea f. rosea IK726]|uniref:Uncharacterized protein n=1 Tax=Clonostachys rosea f. rosea IK726 TaxID=1349383 RepID=A0ACA9THP0_BIOOC|nr:unnamed protein product [Clonostachys rosea f. rosea IK726]
MRAPIKVASAFRGLVSLLLLTTCPIQLTLAYDLDPNSTESVTATAKKMASDMLSYYNGDKPGGTPGLLPDPYYWWEAGAMFGALIEYWYYTKDETYVGMTQKALLFQIGKQKDYMPENQTLTEGNDDQGFWALAVMAAAEYNFPHPGGDNPSWLALAQAVFNTQAPRWDDTSCGGGLRWQIYTWNKGYDYKNSISQGTFFTLGSRLALFTGNQSYADWAVKTWDWMEGVDFIDEKGYVYDGGHIPYNCTNIVPYQFTYNAGVFINGAAAMYNFTENKMWKERLDLLLQGSKVFFTGDDKNIMEEVACEPVDHCNVDQQSFKAYLSRWLAGITQWVPDTYDFVMPYIRASAVAAAKQCTGGSNGRMCGLKWSTGKYDGSSGVGQQMAALEVTLACMVRERDPILTSHTGGTSESDPGAGSEDIGRNKPPAWADKPITTADRAGAIILTIIVIAAMLAGAVWLFVDETSDASFLEQVKGINFSITAILAFLTAGAVVAKKRGSEDGNEKAGQKSSSPGSSSFEQNGRETPLHISRVTNKTEGHVRRASNMPIGWPNISSLRASGALADIEKTAGTTLEDVTAQQTSNTRDEGAVHNTSLPAAAEQTHVEGGAREEVQEQVVPHTAAETKGQGETQAQPEHGSNIAVVTNDQEASPQNASSQPETQLDAKTDATTDEKPEVSPETTTSQEPSQSQTQPQSDVTENTTKHGSEAVQETTQAHEPAQPQPKDDIKAATNSNDLEDAKEAEEATPSKEPLQPQPQTQKQQTKQDDEIHPA